MSISNELYTATEISRMTDDALDELLSHYQDTGNALGAEIVQDEITTRYDEMEDNRRAEEAHKAEEARLQQLHDEMIDDAMVQDGRWG